MSLWTTADVARDLAMSEDWVRDHAAELGGIRVGHPTRGQLRFPPSQIEAYKNNRELEMPPGRRRPPGKRRKPQLPGGIDLLPLPEGAPATARR